MGDRHHRKATLKAAFGSCVLNMNQMSCQSEPKRTTKPKQVKHPLRSKCQRASDLLVRQASLKALKSNANPWMETYLSLKKAVGKNECPALNRRALGQSAKTQFTSVAKLSLTAR